MSIAMLLYLAGMAAIYISERLLVEHELRWVILGAGVVAIGASIGLRARGRVEAEDDGIRYAHTVGLGLSVAGLLAVALYGTTTTGAMELFGFEGVMAERWTGVFGSLWPIGLIAASVPLLAVDFAVSESPVMLPRRRVTQSALNALAGVLAVAILFPVNFVSARHEKQWDFSYFKTAAPSEGTKDLANSVEKPVTVHVFLPAASDVLPEVKSYFSALNAGSIELVVVDQAAEPELARKLKVRNNGVLAFSTGPINLDEKAPESDENSDEKDGLQTHVVSLGGDNLKDARSGLRKLDEGVQQALLALTRGKLTVYLTSGHGELHWNRQRRQIERIDGLKQILEFMNLRIKTLSIGDGLAEEVPEDADVVAILAPTQPFLKSEAEAIQRYLERGGSVFVAAEPKLTRDPRMANSYDGLDDIIAFIGYELGEGVLASESKIVPLTRNATDKLNVTTDRFSVHPSTTVLADRAAELQLFTPTAGWLRENKESKSKRTITVRSRSETWADVNRNLKLDRDAKESKESRTIAGVAVGTEDPPWRAMVIADGSFLSDVAIANPGNQQFVYDGFNWLTGERGVSSAPENEEDVKIQHTREGQGIWFYGTVLGVPLLVLGFGLWRVRRRRRATEATEKDREAPPRPKSEPTTPEPKEVQDSEEIPEEDSEGGEDE